MSQADRKSANPFALGHVPLDQLMALNDEIAALVRAGIPLDHGLTELGREASGNLGLIASRLADRLRAGESLPGILQRDETTFPPVWRSVVLAGIRSGNLAAALEGLSCTGRRALELRRSIAVALVYPVVVVLIAYGFLLFTLRHVEPIIALAYRDLASSSDAFISWMARLSESLTAWAFWIPLGLILAFAFWWFRSGRLMRSSTLADRRSRPSLWRSQQRWRFFSVSQVLYDGRMATFAELLRLMNDHQVPMQEAIVLAADASGDRRLSYGARRIAQRLVSGERLRGREDLPSDFPPLLGWSVVAGVGRGGLSRTLAASAEMYRQRATARHAGLRSICRSL